MSFQFLFGGGGWWYEHLSQQIRHEKFFKQFFWGDDKKHFLKILWGRKVWGFSKKFTTAELDTYLEGSGIFGLIKAD